MTRFWSEAEALKVWAAEDGTPRRLVWNGTVHPVSAILNHWRVDRGWWKEPIWRDYFQVETTTGALLDIYHDLITGKWVVYRVYS